MDAPQKVVGTLWRQPARGSARVLPVHVVLWLQQIVGNREVQRILRPEPGPGTAPPRAPDSETRSWRAAVWLGAGAGIGAGAGAGMSAASGLSAEAGAAVTLAGLAAGLAAAWISKGRRETS